MPPTLRAIAALERRATDRVPIYLAQVSSRVASRLLGRDVWVSEGVLRHREAVALREGAGPHGDLVERSRRDRAALAHALDLDLVRVLRWRTDEKPAERVDEYTFRYDEPDGHWRVMRFDPQTERYDAFDRSPRPEPTFGDLEAQVNRIEESILTRDPRPEDHPEELAAVRAFGDERLVQIAPFSVGVPLRPIWMQALQQRRDLVSRYLSATAQRAARTIQVLSQQGARCFLNRADLADETGPVYGRDDLSELMLPALQRISLACLATDAYHCFASSGNLCPLLPELLARSETQCLCDVDHTSGLDLGNLRTRFRWVALMGGISPHTLRTGDPQRIVQQTLSALQAANARGGTIVGVTGEITPDTPVDNVALVLETLREHR